MCELVYLPGRVAHGELVVAGLAYRSDALTEHLRDRAQAARPEAVVALAPDDLREVAALIEGVRFRLAAVSQERAARTSLAVQLCLLDPPSVRVVGPPRNPRARGRAALERPWLQTLARPLT